MQKNNIEQQSLLNFFTSEQKKTYRQVSKLNDARFLRSRSLRKKINYLKFFALSIEQDEQGNQQYVYRDIHYYDTVLNVFLQFAKDKGLPKRAGYAIAKAKTKAVTNVLDVFVLDRKRVFRAIDKFIENQTIELFLKRIEDALEKSTD